VACIRGGGEYGKAWHDVAVGTNRSISFEDMAYAARYLHSSGLSSPSLTSIYGISNGGLLVAACANRNPELYGAVFADVGVLDLTRFHKFVSRCSPEMIENETNGRLSVDYGLLNMAILIMPTICLLYMEYHHTIMSKKTSNILPSWSRRVITIRVSFQVIP
jgi:pimeloyl-ACP methyl ester carboxylesterase